VAAKRRREIEVSILKKAGVAAVTVEPATSVMDAVKLMKNGGVDTLFVIDQDALLGAFTQRDLAFRVVLGRRDPETTTVREVMTSPAITLRERATVADALGVMAEHRVPQLPIVDERGAIKGMVTLRDIYREDNIDLNAELDSMLAYHTADGIGG
jgi:CBS domain-containing protein